MKINSTYKVKIKDNIGAFKSTAELYRLAVDFYITISLKEWESIDPVKGLKAKQRYVEHLSVETQQNLNPKYNFSSAFYKFPCYLRRAAISEAIGKVSSYKSNYKNWLADNKTGKQPGKPVAGRVYPAMYRDNCFVRTGTYTAELKVFIRNTWDWIKVDLRKSDVDYILHHCNGRKECVPTLQKRGKNWYLDFVFEEQVELPKIPVLEQCIVAVDLGINNACVCSVMKSDGTVIGRKFLKLPKEKDSLGKALNRIKKAQQHGARKMPRLWARTKGINEHIAQLTAQFIIEVAKAYNANVIVFEHLNLKVKKKGSKKQKLHMWKASAVQEIVMNKAHRSGMRISRINAWGTSKFAYDGSGVVKRDKHNYSMCTFETGKRYHCDLSASYNIGARYFIRGILESFSVKERLGIEAKVPQCSKRSTCTLSTLISLNAELAA